MKKLLNSLLYGSSKTKSYLWTLLIVGMGIIGVFIAGFVKAEGVLLALGVFLTGLEMVVLQSMSFHEIIKEGEEGIAHRRKLLDPKTGPVKPDALEEPKQEEDEKEETYLDQYDEAAIKKVLLAYKVKKEHKKIMIDHSSHFSIVQCPAFIWKDKKCLQLLLLEDKPRIIKLPLEKMKAIGYAKMQEASPKDYAAFQKNGFASRLFFEFLPKTYELSAGGERLYKNLYVIAPDIRITNTSAKNAFDLLEIDFYISDKTTNSPNYDDYFKMAYKASILWKDEVIDTNEYKEKIKILLSSLATENISDEAFEESLRQLVKHKLITKDYAEYYREIRKG